ncbi:peptidase S8 and S53 subtilisin kexin sedolisin [Actinoplanes sp. ATCC 53533]|uniref:S8 family serine peptidase n=1 Tax=Actinoplanes sp. ATCC 53533 TaxID=1288362 RepID=UPI000F7B936C|nr:S8 family serine peptidase [Actinoplanes sp. ATCC 53533]RSM40665.1 peptidase S8 and S53 subtilisin kexin sedolisin [Actinoplanes sp. ATCC 53533]
MRKLAALTVTAVAVAGTLVVTAPAHAAGGAGWLSANWLVQSGTTKLSTVIKAAGADEADKDNPDDGDSATGVALTGAGIGVALIDSGVSPVKGLDGAGKVIHGPDLSFESQAPNLRYLDTFGHGTHMAGIIAGQDTTTGIGTPFAGVAPGAHVISVKVASADGASDVSQVIAGIDWAVAHRNDPGLNIRVLNLSYGTQSTQPAALDPLAYAVEKAWEAGIVVVVAAGNDGFAANSLTMPAADPDVIAVGGADTRDTDARTDDVVADFSNRGNAARHPDVLAAGRSVVSLRSPGSYIDRTYPGARLSLLDDPEQRFLRGSGTSQAAAMVSGSVALLLQQRPGLRPDQVKKLLMSTADPILYGDAYAAGAGQINVARAARTRSVLVTPQLNVAATGLGSLEAARGGAYVYDSVTGTPLTGERDIFGMAWDARAWTVASATQRSWIGGTWNGSTWTGSYWTGSYWTGTYWGATVFGGQAWAPATWTGRSWSGVAWSGRSWSSAVWSGRSWSSQTWTGRSWSGRSWSAAGWTGEPWH